MNNADQPAMAQPVNHNDYGEVTVAADHDKEYMGLTKREYFAAKAMQGIVANQYLMQSTICGDKSTEMAQIAVGAADALLKELEK